MITLNKILGKDCTNQRLYSNQTEGWVQAIAACSVELEKETWFKNGIGLHFEIFFLNQVSSSIPN